MSISKIANLENTAKLQVYKKTNTNFGLGWWVYNDPKQIWFNLYGSSCAFDCHGQIKIFIFITEETVKIFILPFMKKAEIKTKIDINISDVAFIAIKI